jgi:hypothetical protein
MLAIYRELKLNQTDMHALEEHLSQCIACKEVQTQYDLAGEGLRALPRIEPLPDAHTKLMQTLATEHIRFIQNTSASIATTPTPAFLAPYLKDLAQTPRANNLAAFATADTGPIPIVQQSTKRHPIYQINHFTIIGVAASFLMMLLVGSLTSLVLLTQHGSSITPPSLVVHQLNDVRAVNYTATPVYPHVASAAASGHDIYYTTYNDDQTSWQLEQFDEKANITTPLLAKPSTQELIVLGSSANWLVWLQIDPPKLADAPSQATNDTSTPPARAWSLHAQYLGSTLSPVTQTAPSDREFVSKIFNPTTVPSWVNRPVQGICFIQNTLLVALIDAQGISHLQSYQLDPVKEITQTELANASQGHLLASPTANSDGTDIYWADEYSSNASGQLSSDIWTQQTVDASPTNAGRWAAHQTTKKYPFRADGQSFHPQIVNDTLFLLSTSHTDGNTPDTISTVAATPPTLLATATPQTVSTVTTQPTATPTAVNIATLPEGATNLDPWILAPQIDTLQTGRILSFTASGVMQALPQFDNTQIVTAFQGGAGFLLWQEPDGSTFGMYDVIAKAPVQVGDNVVPPDATFLAVNGDTAVSVTGQQNSLDQHNQARIPITFDTFRWPIPRS